MQSARLTILLLISTCLHVAGQQATPSPTPDTLLILDKVNSFYSNSFGQLLTLTLAFLGFAGVLLPIILQILQARVFRTEQKTLQAQITADTAAAKAELKADIDSMFQADQKDTRDIIKREVESLSARITQQLSALRGGNFFLQGNNNVAKGKHAAAASDFAYAAIQFFTAQEDTNAQRAITMTEESLKKVNNDAFGNEQDLDENLNDLLKWLNEHNTNDRFSDTMWSLRKRIDAAKKRAEPQPQS